MQIDNDDLSRSAQFQLPSDMQSVATTALASEIGSVVGNPKDAYQRSITFVVTEDLEWGIDFQDPSSSIQKRSLFRKQQGLTVGNISGVIDMYSMIQPGDQLRSINGKRIGPSYNASRAMDLLEVAARRDGILSIAVGNSDGDDTLIQATVLKPFPDTTAAEMGITTWFWGDLCVKALLPESLFSHTVLKDNDRIVSVNNIVCDRVTPEKFNHLVSELPCEITIVVKRGRQRWSGKFG